MCAKKRVRRILNRQKNIMRGALATGSSGGYSINDSGADFKRKRSIKSALFRARHSLPVEEFEEYLSWAHKLISSPIVNARTRVFEYHDLNNTLPANPVSLERELVWIANHLSTKISQINPFLRKLDALEQAVWKGEDETAFGVLLAIKKEMGESFWQIETEISLAQHFYGLEAQKKIKDLIREEANRGLVPFVAHFIGVRNEPNVSLSRFVGQIQKKLETSVKEEGLRSYLLYRLTGYFPDTYQECADILRLEQNHSIIDLYQTFIALLQHLVSVGFDKRTGEFLNFAVTKLEGIDDFRLQKLAFSLGAREQLPEIKIHKSRSALLRGDIVLAYRNAMKELDKGCSLSCLINAGVALAHKRNITLKNKGALKSIIVSRLAVIFSKGTKFKKAVQDIEKLALNFRGLPKLHALHSVFLLQGGPLNTEDVYGGKWHQLNNSEFSNFDFILIGRLDLGVKNAKGPERQFLELLNTGKSQNNYINEEASEFFTCLFLTINGEYQKAIPLLINFLTFAKSALLHISAKFLLVECYLRNGDLQDAYKLLAKIGAANQAILPVLAVDAAVKSFSWQKIRSHFGDISIPIVLDFHCSLTEDDTAATFRRIAVSRFLANQGVKLPSELPEKINGISNLEHIYFLKEVCVPTVLDMLPEIGSSNYVDKERIKICSILLKIDEANSELYKEEIVALKNKIFLQEGMKTVDKSRVYVDPDVIKKWAQKELKESYERYLALVSAGVGVADDFDAVLEAIEGAQGNSLSIPDSEADELLLSMIIDIKHQFLLNEEHGLDSYLGRRIRHNTMHGFVRGPLENAQLITQRTRADEDYKRNEYWLKQLTGLSQEQREKVSAHFIQFSKSFDNVMLDLKNKYLHIKSDDHPEGFFELNLSPSLIHLIRSTVQTLDRTLEGFVNTCVLSFWAMLDPSLKRTRDFIQKDVKTRVAETFAVLRASLKRDAKDDPAFSYLMQNIGDTYGQVMTELDKISEWFKVHETDHSRIYSVSEMIKICVATATATNPEYAEKVSVSIEGDAELSFRALGVIVDIVEISLDNAYRHSRLGCPPEVKIVATICRDQKIFNIKIVNEVSPMSRKREEKKVEKLKEDIKNGDYHGKQRSEGESGLKKIAAIVYQSQYGRFDFGYRLDSSFFLDIDLSLHVDSGSENRLQLTEKGSYEKSTAS